MAERERERIIKRTHEGRQLARQRGVKTGRKPKLNDHQQKIAVKRLAAGQSARMIAEDIAVSHHTINRLR